MTFCNRYLDDIVEISREAGSAIMRVYDTEFDVTRKDDQSPLTEADLAAHHIIVDGLKRLTPDIPVLSEESADIPFETRRQWQLYWLVDPLDGTREFVKRNGEFTVNIALIEDGRPQLGVIHAPVLDTTYAGTLTDGAWKQVGDGPRQEIRVRKFPAGTVTIAGSRSHRGNSLNDFLDRIGDHELVSMGSSLKSCLVAEGRADVYPRFGPTSEWDTAAAQAVVEAAGGCLTTLDLQPLRYNRKPSLLNPHFMVLGDANIDWRRYLEVT